MGRRSPGNPRYQKGSDVGKTRRSAASAKPKRAAGDSAASASSAKDKKGRRRLLSRFPSSPELRRWRKIWAVLLVVAVAFSLFAWWQSGTVPGTVALAFAYVAIFAALYVDFAKIRSLRKAAMARDEAARAAGKGGKKPDAAESDAAESDAKTSDSKKQDTKRSGTDSKGSNKSDAPGNGA